MTKQKEKKTCAFCGKPFTPLQTLGGRRKYCYRPECEEAREQIRRDKMRKRYKKRGTAK